MAEPHHSPGTDSPSAVVDKLVRSDVPGALVAFNAASGALRAHIRAAMAALDPKVASTVLGALEKAMGGVARDRAVVAELYAATLPAVAAKARGDAEKVLVALASDASPRLRALAATVSPAARAKALLDDASTNVRAAAAARLIALGEVLPEEQHVALVASAHIRTRVAGLEAPLSASADLNTQFRKAAADPNRSLRRRALKALAGTAAGNALVLSAATGDKCPIIRRESAAALDVDPATQRSTLALILDREPDAETRLAALTAVMRLSNEERAPLLAKALIDLDGAVRARAHALSRDGETGPDELKADLLVRSEAWDAVVALGDAALAALYAAAERPGTSRRETEARLAALAALTRLRAADMNRLGPLVNDADGRVRAAAIDAIEGAGPSAVDVRNVEALIAATLDREARVRAVAIRAVGNLGRGAPSARVAIGVSAAFALLADPEPPVRAAAIKALAALAAVEALAVVARDPDADTRVAALEQLATFKEAESALRQGAISAVVVALGDELPLVRLAAERAVKQLGWAPVGLPDLGDRGYERWLTPGDFGATATEARAKAGKSAKGPTADLLESVLLPALDHVDARFRRAAVEALGRERVALSLLAVRARLEDSDALVRLAAAEATVALGDPPGAGEAFAAWHVRREAFDAAAALGAAAVAPLSGALAKHPVGAFRRAAAVALGQTGAATAALALESALSDPEPAVAVAASDALLALKLTAPPLAALCRCLDSGADIVRFAGERALTGFHHAGLAAAVLAALDLALSPPSPPGLDAPGRGVAALLLGRLLDARASEAPKNSTPGWRALFSALHDPVSSVRAAATTALGPSAPESRLFELLGESDPGVVRAARGALAALTSSPEIAAALATADRLAQNRWAALADSASPTGTQAVLLGALSEASREPDVNTRRAYAAAALGHFPTDEARAGLESVLADPIPTVRIAAARSLGQHAHPGSLVPLAATLAIPDVPFLVAVMAAIADIATPAVAAGADLGAAGSAVRAGLDHAAPDVRVAAAEACARIDHADLAVPLIPRLGDPNADVASAAETALAALLHHSSTPAALESALPGGSIPVRRALARLLAIGAPERLKSSLSDADPGVRRIAAEGLGRLTGKTGASVIPLLLPKRFDPDPDCRAAVFKSLGVLGAPRTAVVGALADPATNVRLTFEDRSNPVPIGILDSVRAGSGVSALRSAPAGLVTDLHSLLLHAAMTGRMGAPARADLCRALAGAEVPGLVQALLHLAETSEVAIAVGAIDGLAHPTAVDAFDRLVWLAEQGSGDTRAAAIGALAAIDSKRGASVILRHDAAGDFRVRAAVATALGTLPDVALEPHSTALFGLLADPSPEVRSAAAQALGRLASAHEARPAPARAFMTATAPLLVTAAFDAESAVRTAATRSLAPASRIAPAALAAIVTGDPDATRRRVAIGYSVDAKAIATALSDPDSGVRTGAATQAAQVPATPELLTALARRMGDEDADVRAAALRAISAELIRREVTSASQLPEGLDPDPVLGALADPESAVRAAARDALERLALEPDPGSRLAADALAARGDPTLALGLSAASFAEPTPPKGKGRAVRPCGVAVLLTFVRVHRGLPDAKVAAVARIATVPRPDAARALADALTTAYPEVINAAARALRTHPEAAVVQDALEARVVAGPAPRRAIALEALAAAVPARAIPFAETLISHGEPALRIASCRAFGEAVQRGALKFSRCQAQLVTALADVVPGVRAAAAKALGLAPSGVVPALNADATSALLDRTNDADAGVRDAAAETLAAAAEGIRDALAARLTISDATARRTIVGALRNDAPSAAVLLPYVDDGDAAVRHAAIWALASLAIHASSSAAPEDVASRIATHLVDTDSDVRAMAAQALGQIGASETVSPGARSGYVVRLAGLLADRDARPRIAAAASLRRLGADGATLQTLTSLATDVREHRWARLGEVLSHGGVALIAHALETDTVGGRRFREQLASTLSGRAEPFVVSALIRSLKDTDPLLRAAAARALGHPAAIAAVPTLVVATRETRAEVRAAAVEALCKADPTQTGPLFAALSDPFEPVRLAAATGLGEVIPTPALATALESALRPSDPTLLHAAAHSLARLALNTDAAGKAGARTAGAALTRALESPDVAVRVAAAAGAVGHTTALVKALADVEAEVRRAAAESLAQCATAPAARVALIGVALHDASALVRRAAVDALRGLSPREPDVDDALVAALADRDPAVLDAARAAFPGHDRASIPDVLAARRADQLVDDAGSAVPALLVAVADGRFGLDDGPRRASAAMALGLSVARGVQDPRIVPALIAQLDADDAVVRAGAARGLGVAGDTRVIPALSQRLAAADPGAERRAFAEGLGALGAGDALASAATDPDPVVRRVAAATCRDHTTLLLLVGDRDLDVARTAGARLAAVGGQDRLGGLLDDTNVNARLGAVAGLEVAARAGHGAAESALHRAGLDSAPAVRAAALRAAAAVRTAAKNGKSDGANLATLVVELLGRDPDDSVRLAAAGVAVALAQLDRSTAKRLEAALDLAVVDASADVVRAARAGLDTLGRKLEPLTEEIAGLAAVERFDAIGQLGPAVVPYLERILSERWTDRLAVTRRVGAAKAAGQLGAPGRPALELAAADPAERVRQAAARAARGLPDPDAFAVLDRLAADVAVSVREEVCRSLGELGGSESVERLVVLRLDGDEHVRLAAAVALAGPKTAAVAKVAELLLERDSALKIKGANLLAELGHPGGIEPLIVALGDADARVRLHVRAALGALGWTPVGHRTSADAKGYAFWTSRAEWLAGLPGGQGEHQGLAAALASPDAERRRDAAEGLEALGDAAAIPALAGVLTDLDPDVRLSAATAIATLIRVGRAGATSALSPDARARIAILTGRMEDAVGLGEGAVAALVEVLATGSVNAARVLATIGPAARAARVPLEAALAAGDPALRDAAATALGHLGDRAAATALARALADDAHAVAAAAGRGLAALGDLKSLEKALAPSASRYGAAVGLEAAPASERPAAALVKALRADSDPDTRVALIAAATGVAPAFDAVCERLSTDDEALVRAAAATALAQSATPSQAAAALMDALSDASPTVRTAATASLAHLGTPGDPSALALALAVARNDWTSTVRAGPAAIPLLTRVTLERTLDKDAVLRRAGAVKALETLGAFDAVTAAASDRASPVRAAVLAAFPAALQANKITREIWIPVIRSGLADVDTRARRHAATAAGLIGDTESIPTLSDLAANDRDGGVRDAAAIALAKPAMRSIDALVRTLEKGDATERAAAAVALGEAGLGDAVDPLVKALGDPSTVVRTQARGALEKLGFAPVGVPDSAELRATPVRIARFLDFSALSARVGAPATPPDGAAAMVVASETRLLTLIGVGSAIERLGGLLALNDLLSHPARVGDREAATSAVAARLEDGIIAVRRAAALWLRDAGLLPAELPTAVLAAALVELNQDAAAAELGAAAVPALTRASREAPEPERRAAACAGLGRLELDAADPALSVVILALAERLSDDHIDGRIAAASAFGVRGAFDPALEAALGDPSDAVRTAAAEALAGLGDAGRSALERALEAGDAAIREAGCEGLERLGSEADTLEDRLAALLASDGDDAVRIAAARALAHVGTDALPRLTTALEQDPHPAVRAQSARSLALRGDESAVPCLEAALADDDVAVRASATAALESFGWVPAGPVARALLALSQSDFDAVIAEAPEETALSLLGRVLSARGTDLDTAERKCRVLDAILRSRRPGLAPIATRALSDRAARVRRAALPLVVALGLTDSLDTLAQLAEHDTSDAVRTAACGAIGSLALRLAAGGVNDALSGCVRALERVARQDLDANVRLAAATALAQPGLLSLSLLIEQLSATGADVRATAARTLGLTMRREAVSPLVSALSDIAKPVQTASRDALTALGWAPVGLPTSTTREGAGYARWLSDADLVPAGLPETGPFAAAQSTGLLDALARPDAAWRLAALDGLDTLVRSGLVALDRRAQTTVAERLADAVPLVRRAAARLLAPLPGDTTTRARSMAILGQYDGAAAAGALDALLLELDGPLAPADRARLIAALATVKATAAQKASLGERLAAQLADTDAIVRAAAATALGRLGERPDALETALGDDSDVVRNAASVAVAGLGELGHEILARAFASSRAELREAACDGVRALSDASVGFEAEVTRALTSDDDVGVRLAAARALAVLPADVQSALAGALDCDVAPIVRAEAARALAVQAARLGKKATAHALGTLEAALADDDVLVRDATQAGLGQLGWTAQGRTSRALLALAGNDFASVLDAGFGPSDDGAPTAASAQMATGLLGRVLAARGTDADTADRKCRVLDTLARSSDAQHGPLVASAMTDPVAKVRRAAVATAVALSHRDAPDILGALAEHDVSDAVRSAACGAIGALGLASLVKTLERVARLDRDARVRLAASTALASPGLLSLDLLIDQLSSPSADVRTDAATALGATGRREAIGPLTTALSDIAKSVQTAARAGLAALGWVPVGLPTTTDVSDTRSLSRWLTDVELVPSGLPADGPFADAEASALIGLLGHRDPRWRLAVADGLEGLVTSGLLALDAEGAAAIARALDDDESAVRIAVATILTRAKTTPSAVRGAVHAALGDYAGAAALGALKALLHELRSPLPAALREALLGALATLPPEHDSVLAPILARELDAPDAAVRAAAACAFETRRLHDPALAAHLGDPAEVVRQALAHALAATGEPGLADLEAALTNGDPATREAACMGLGRLGSDANRLTSALAALLADTADGVRVAATRALAHVGDDDVLPALLGALDADTSPMVRAEAARSLGLRGALGAMNALESALADDDVLVRAAATASLHALGWEPRGRTSRALLALSENDFSGVISAGFDEDEGDVSSAATEAVAAGLLRRVLTARGTDADTAERKVRVLETLARSGRSALASLSIDALADRVARVRRAAVVTTVALGVAHDAGDVTRAPLAAESLAQLAEHDSSDAVRAAACGAIGALGLAGCVKTLERIARSDRDPNVRLAAATALASPSLRSLDLLIDQLTQGAPDARTAAATALGATGRREAVGPLTAALADIHKPVQVAAREALIALGWVPVGLASTLDGRGFGRWLNDVDLVRDGLPEYAPFGDAQARGLLGLAGHDSPTWRLAAMVGLADLVHAHLTTLALDVGDTLDTLLSVLGDPTRAVRRAAAHLMALAATPGDVSPWRGQALAVVGRYAEAAELGARDALLHELAEPLPAAERADLLLALASLPGDVDDGIIVALVGELDATDAVVRMAAASALERVFARVPSEPEPAPDPEAPPVELAPADVTPEAAPPADEPPPEPKKKKKK
ncbi:MAG: HEAT repeat domain-containing protein [Myxococcales bacterium]|nr:HEAT repeat domain-containing protein [Myxococcales bacterium]